MPTLRKDIVKRELEKAGISLARMAKELGFNNRVTFYNHFDKEDIDLDLYNSIMTKLVEKGAQFDSSVKFTVKSGRDSIINNGTSVEGLNAQIALLKEQLKEAHQRIIELERGKK